MSSSTAPTRWSDHWSKEQRDLARVLVGKPLKSARTDSPAMPGLRRALWSWPITKITMSRWWLSGCAAVITQSATLSSIRLLSSPALPTPFSPTMARR